MKKITKEWLREKGACAEGYEWFIRQRVKGEVDILEQLEKEEKYDWANWLIVRRMTRPQYLQYAVFAAEQVIGSFEKRYPNDKRLRLAIEATRRCITDDSPEARTAAYAAYRHVHAAYAVYSATSVADAVTAVAYAVYSAAFADPDAVAYVAAHAALADAEMQQRILAYGISLLKVDG